MYLYEKVRNCGWATDLASGGDEALVDGGLSQLLGAHGFGRTLQHLRACAEELSSAQTPEHKREQPCICTQATTRMTGRSSQQDQVECKLTFHLTLTSASAVGTASLVAD